MPLPRVEVLQGTLDLIVLHTLHSLGPLHGYGISVRIQQVSAESLQLGQGSLYPALVRLESRKWIASEWGTSENNRRARFYRITAAGKKQLAHEIEQWQTTVGLIAKLLEAK